MINEPFVHIQRIEELRIESCQQHIDHNGDVYFVWVRIIFVAIFLVLDALLHILVIGIKLFDDMVGAILSVIIVNDFF